MTRNPRQPYLYLNFVAGLNKIIYRLGHFTPAEGFWCNRDGSMVVEAENASALAS